MRDAFMMRGGLANPNAGGDLPGAEDRGVDCAEEEQCEDRCGRIYEDEYRQSNVDRSPREQCPS
jgi:hypothetical protein